MPGRQFLGQFEKVQSTGKHFICSKNMQPNSIQMSKNLEPVQKPIFLMEISE